MKTFLQTTINKASHRLTQGIFVCLIALPYAANSQVIATPKSKLPIDMIEAVDDLGQQFAKILEVDCAPELCFARGCVYQTHETVIATDDVDPMPGLNTQLPKQGEKPQNFLSKVRCEYAFEGSVDAKTIKSIDNRLEFKLSKGMLKVSVKSYPLPTIEKPKAPSANDQAKTPEPLFKNPIANELWTLFKPHFYWIAGTILGAFVLLLLIWAARRLGVDSKVDELQFLDAKRKLEGVDSEANKQAENAAPDTGDQALMIRKERLNQSLRSKPEALERITHQWLEQEEFSKLKAAATLFQDNDLKFLPDQSAGTTQKMIKFFEYLNDSASLDQISSGESLESLIGELEKKLVEATSFRSSSVEVFTRYFQRNSPRQIAESIADMPKFCSKATFLLLPENYLPSVVKFIPETNIVELAESVMDDHRLSDSALKASRLWISALIEGKNPMTVDMEGLIGQSEQRLSSGGEAVEVSTHLSVLFDRLSIDNRKKVLERAKQKNAGEIPEWCQSIFYPSMLGRVPDSLKKELLIEVAPKHLSIWLQQIKDKTLYNQILAAAPAALRQHLQNNTAESSLSAQDAHKIGVKVGRSMGIALSRQYHKGQIRLEDLI